MLLNEDDLAQWCGYKRPTDIARFLEQNGIRYLKGKDGRICTTQDAIDAVLVAKPPAAHFNREPDYSRYRM